MFFSVALVAISCGGSDNPSPTVNTTCQLTKSSTTSQTSGTITTYKYGSDGKVTEINLKRTTTTPAEETTVFTYDATGKVSKRKTTYSGTGAVIDYTFIYKVNGQLEKLQQVSGSNTADVIFEYNANNQITKVKYPTNITYTYTYNNGNLASFSSVIDRDTYLLEYKNYDDKKNPLNGLAYAFPDNPQYSSPNNYRDITQMVNGQISIVNRPSFTHTYNTKNLPIKTDFKNGSQEATTVYEYANCQ